MHVKKLKTKHKKVTAQHCQRMKDMIMIMIMA